MKVISQGPMKEVSNAWGRTVRQRETELEIEDVDVGRVLENKGGYRHSSHTVTYGDIGKRLIKYEDGKGWNCWIFVSTPVKL